MSIQNLPVNTVSDVEPSGVGSPARLDTVESAGTEQAHVPPEESPDDGPPLADLIEEEPTTDDGQRALRFGSSRHLRKRRIVAKLLDRGRDTLARKVASCENNGFDCQRPHLCRLCHRHKRFEAKKRHSSRIKQWDNHVHVALTMPTTQKHPAVARNDVLGRFQTARRRVQFTNAVNHAFGGIHTVKDDETGDFRAHLDVLCNASEPTVIQSELSSGWADVGGGHVETTRLTPPSGRTYADAVEATTCYVVEKTDLPVSAQVDYASLRPDAPHWTTFSGA